MEVDKREYAIGGTKQQRFSIQKKRFTFRVIGSRLKIQSGCQHVVTCILLIEQYPAYNIAFTI
jgi:hypothetical protein